MASALRSTGLLRLGFRHIPSLLFRGPLFPAPSLGLGVGRVGLVRLRCLASEAGDGRGKKVSARLALAQQVMRDAEERAASAGSDPAPKITMDHVTVSFARSGGAGGQNVNKVNTKVDMRFNVEKAHWLGERIKERILQTEKNRINREGELVMSSTKTRTQKGNIEDALQKIQAIIDAASYVPPPPSEEQKKKIEKMRDCGFFMLQIAKSWNGKEHTKFTYRDIPNIKRMMLFEWATSSVFSLNLEDLFGYNPGCADGFSLFGGQMYQPKAHHGNGDCIMETFEPTTSEKQPVEEIDVINLDDESHSSGELNQTKKTHKKSKKWSASVEELKPCDFKNIENARLLRQFILNDIAKEKHNNTVFCRFAHGVDDTEEAIDTEITGENLASVFDEFGQIEGELMKIIMRNWKFDNTYSHMFDSCTRIILSPYFITYVLQIDGMNTKSKFNIDTAVSVLKRYVRPEDNLNTAKLIMMPYNKKFPGTESAHYALYAMNKYRATFDVLDSMECKKGSNPSRSSFHKDTKEIARRMVLLMKAVYGDEDYNNSGHPNWQKVAEKPRFVKVPLQGINQCGFYCLKFASGFDGDKLVNRIEDNDPHVDDWKAEYLYTAVFHSENRVSLEDMPDEICSLAPSSTKGAELISRDMDPK